MQVQVQVQVQVQISLCMQFPCGSEFIREKPVHQIKMCGMSNRLANEFAPTEHLQRGVDQLSVFSLQLLIFTHGSPDTTNRDLGAGRTQVALRGPSGMNAARAAPRHGWRMAAGPRSVAGVREPDEGGPNQEQGLFGYFCVVRHSDS